MRQPFGAQLVAGDLWKWSIALDDYSAGDGWVIKYFIRGNGQKLDLASVPDVDGTSFLVTSAAIDTANFPLGDYAFQAVITKDAERYELARGVVALVPNLETADVNYDGRSWVKRSLDAVRKVIENRASRIDLEYNIAGRQLKTMSPEQLMTLEGELSRRYRRELIQSGQVSSNSNQIRGSFGDPQDAVLRREWRKFPGGGA